MKNLKYVLGIVALLLIGFLVYKNLDLEKKNQSFELSIQEEKLALQEELNLAIDDLGIKETEIIDLGSHNNQVVEKFNQLKTELDDSKQRLLTLTEELKTEKTKDYKTIRLLRNELGKLKRTNKKLFQEMSVLQFSNDSLKVEVAIVKSELNLNKAKVEDLEAKQEDLNSKILNYANLRLTDVEVIPVMTDKKGMIKPTVKRKKVDAIQLKYNIIENDLMEGKSANLYYVIKDEKGSVIQKRGTFLYKDVLTQFTDGNQLTYHKNQLQIQKNIDIAEGILDDGVYTVIIYSENERLGSQKFELKKSFLNVF